MFKTLLQLNHLIKYTVHLKWQTLSRTAMKTHTTSARTHLVVLVGRHRDEGCLGEHVSAEGRVFGAEAVIFICLHDVDPRLILVHRV